MRIQNNSSAINAYRNYSSNANSVNKTAEKLSSGYSVNRAGDDAAGLAISEKLRADQTGLAAEYGNLRNEASAAQIADGALAEVHDTLNRMQELAATATNGTYSGADRGALQDEFSQLKTELNRIYDSTSFNGNRVLENDLDLDDVDISTPDGAAAAMDSIAGAIDSVSGQRAEVGALQNRIEHASNNLSSMAIETQSAESLIRDADIAQTVMEQTKNKILMQASQSLMAQANQTARGVLQFLQ